MGFLAKKRNEYQDSIKESIEISKEDSDCETEFSDNYNHIIQII